MLIECPEYKKMISDKAIACPNCGYPISEINTSKDTDIEAIDVLHKSGIIDFMKKIGEDHNFSTLSEIKEYVNKTPKLKSEYDLAVSNNKKLNNNPQCPTCGSTNVKPISDTERVASVIGLGLLSKKINKSYKCLNCKYTW